MYFKNETKDDIISNFISSPYVVTLPRSRLLGFVIDKYNEKETLDNRVTQEIPTTPSLKGVPIRNSARENKKYQL